MTEAERIVASLNPNAPAFEEDGLHVFIEDITDPDGRMYRVEYVSTEDGQHAISWCRYNPWAPDGPPNAGADYHRGHIAEDGLICIGSDHTREAASSPHSLSDVVERTRYWATAFSVFKEQGEFPQP